MSIFTYINMSFGAAVIQDNIEKNGPDMNSNNSGFTLPNATFHPYVEYDDQGRKVNKYNIIISEGSGGSGTGGGISGSGINRSSSTGNKQNNSGGTFSISINSDKLDDIKRKQIEDEITRSVNSYSRTMTSDQLQNYIQSKIDHMMHEYEQRQQQLEEIAKQRETKRPDALNFDKPIIESTTYETIEETVIERPTEAEVTSLYVKEETTTKVQETSKTNGISGIFGKIINDFFKPKETSAGPIEFIETEKKNETVNEEVVDSSEIEESIAKATIFHEETTEAEVVAEETTIEETSIEETVPLETTVEETKVVESETAEETKIVESESVEETEVPENVTVEETTVDTSGEKEETTEGEFKEKGGLNKEDGHGDGRGSTDRGVKIFELKRKGNIGITPQGGINVIQGLVYTIASILLLLIGILFYLLPNTIFDKYINKSKYLI